MRKMHFDANFHNFMLFMQPLFMVHFIYQYGFKQGGDIVGNKILFKGCGTALATPFTSDGSVDYYALDKLIEMQIEGGVSALVICGTSGEASTMDDDEHISVIAHCVKRVKGRCTVFGGTGSNDTRHGIRLTKRACDAGIDGCLVVTPYYNKTTPEGLKVHFTAYADASEKPIILYNVPSRTGMSLDADVCEYLSKHENICGIKEASGNVPLAAEIIRRCGDALPLYSGEDGIVVPLMSLGGKGVISVLSNLLPAETEKMCRLCLENDFRAAAELQLKYTPLINCLFSRTNPIPVKAALSRMGYGTDMVRLPLIPMEEPYREKLYKEMEKLGI